MCQLEFCTILLSLLVCSGYIKETTSRNSNAGVHVKSSISVKPINNSKHFPDKLTRFINIPRKTSVFSEKKLSESILGSSTLKTRKHKSPVLNAKTLNLRKLRRHTLNQLNTATFRTRTLNSPSVKARTVNFAALNPYIPEDTHNSPRLNNKIDIHEIHDEKLEEWLEDTNVNYSLSDDNFKDTRRTQIQGLHEFKSRFKEESMNSETFIDNEKILNNKYELDQLQIHDPILPNFNESFVDVAAEKLTEIQSKYLKLKVEEEVLKSARRDMTKIKPNPMDRILALMDQFIFQSQKRLINGQLLRRKYVIYVKYKLGYTFSLLRILKQQQLRIYSNMHFYRFYTPTVKGTWYDTSIADADYYLMLYEKLTKLDDDIVTLVNFMWQLEAERKVQAAIDATKFPKRKKHTPGEAATYFVPKLPNG